MAAWLRDWWWLLPIALLYLTAAVVFVKWPAIAAAIQRREDRRPTAGKPRDDHRGSSW